MSKDIVESSDKKCKFLKVLATIFVIAGVILLIVGIVDVFRNTFSVMQDSSHFSFANDDFENNIDLSKLFSGLTCIGIAMGLFIASIVLFSIYRKKNIVVTTSSDETIFDKIEETVKTVSESIKKATETESKPKEEVKPKQHIYCAYCGSELDEDDKKCPSCGASRKFRK